jgi:ATP-dependent RNA helicase RhlE
MYNKYNRSGHGFPDNKNRNNFNRNRHSNRFSRGGSRIKYMDVDPKMLVKKAVPQESVAYTNKHSFSDFLLDSIIQRNIVNKGYKNPTPIQDQAIKPILEGKDVVGLASTGTGKTAAFLLPIIQKTIHNPFAKAIIITPTRELATQIIEEGRTFSQGTRCYFSIVIGGVPIFRQIGALKKNPQVVVGTPGRIKDLVERGALNLSNYQTIVLDEVDRMLDMGFINDIREIVTRLPEKRHSLFFSATINKESSEIAKTFLKDPVTIRASIQKASDNVDQDIVKVAGRSKVEILHDLLIKPEFERVLVFGRTKHGLERLFNELVDRGFSVSTIHGNKSQPQRQRALDSFKSNRVKILLATDVASRGIDVENVTHVINYELPETYEDYIHRIGRTGRANKTGVALTFIE